ncbi:unnamed protein product [Calicophoron daubneyi]|uniref:DZANK-type domain-containing protein n=1 Tax=Calicophoron daubneyi TaxID=300641 RepID=A0AAV2TYJ4_CALDB
MSAGAVRAPLIIPVRDPEIGGPSSKIDSRTLLDLMSDTPNVDIYFTINGGRPIIKKHERELLNAGTYKFRNPFTLPPGVQTIRAVAYLPSTGCESNMVTKTFDVLRAPGAGISGTGSDDYQFLEDLKAIEAHRKKSSRKRSDKPDSEDFISKLIEADQKSHNAQIAEEKPNTGVPVSPTKKHTASKMVMCDLVQQCEQSEKCNSDVKTPRRLSDSSQTSRAPDAGKSPEESHPRHSVPEYPVDASLSFRRLQRATDILRCPYCLNPRPPGRTQQFCGYCGQALPKLPDADTPALAYDRLGRCASCGSTVPFSLPTCLACEAPLGLKTDDKDPQSQEFRICTTCGAPNPSHMSSCLTCEARLASGAQNLVGPRTMRSQRMRPPPTPPSVNPLMLNASNSVGASSQLKFISCPHCQRENNADARYCDWCGLEVYVSKIPYTDRQCFWSSNSTPAQRPRDSASFYYSQGDCAPPRSYEMKNTDVNQQNLRCTKCGRMVDTNAKFCPDCGSRIEPNPRTMAWTTVTNTAGANEASGYWQSEKRTTSRQHGPPISNAATQTVGLFYPSSAELRRKESLSSSRSANDLLHDRTPLLTAVSPGRGFWRKQLDHIVAHLKVYTSNNPEFRAALGEPRFGKLISANLREGRTEARITLTYALPRTPSAKRMEDSEKPLSRSQTETTAVGAQLRRSDDEISHRDGRTRNRGSVRRKTDSARTKGSQEDNDSDRVSVTLHSNPHDQVASDDSYEFVGDMNDKQLSQSLADLSHSYGLDDLSDGFESAEPRRPPERRKTTEVPKRRTNGNKVKRADSDAGEKNSARSRNTTSSRGSTSSRKSGAEQSKHMDIGKHPGEAGVALLRESKLTTSDRALLHLLSEPGEGTEDDINRALKERYFFLGGQSELRECEW